MNGNAEREREREAGTRTVLLPARSGLENGIGPMLSYIDEWISWVISASALDSGGVLNFGENPKNPGGDFPGWLSPNHTP